MSLQTLNHCTMKRTLEKPNLMLPHINSNQTGNSRNILNPKKFRFQNGLQQILFTILILAISLQVNGTVYYVSNSGNDSNSGTSESQAWKSLAKVNSFVPKAGDQILFKSGDSWSGSLNISASGVSGSPIVYGSFGTGAKPKIYGSEVITDWTLHSGNIYKAQFSGKIKQLFINDKRLSLARYPKEGFLDISTVNNSTQFISNQLASKTQDYYKNAMWVGRTSAWTLIVRKVKTSADQSITLDEAPYMDLGAKEGFFLCDKLEFLTQPGEWHFDELNNTVYLWTPNSVSPTNFEIRGSIYDYGININQKNYIKIVGLEILQSAMFGVYLNQSNNITLDNNRIINPAHSGIRSYFWSNNSIISNNYISGANNYAIKLYNNPGALIYKNEISESGQLKNISRIVTPSAPGDAWGYGIDARIGDMTILENRIINSGYIGILFMQGAFNVKNNFIQGACQVLDDGGGIYTYNGADYTQPGAAGSIITGNIILDTYGNPDGGAEDIFQGIGIYLDNGTHDVKVENNLIAGSTIGLFLHEGGRNTISFNTIFNSMLLWYGSKEYEDSRLTDNILFTTDRRGHPLYWGTNTHQRIVFQSNASAIFDNNKYFCPYTKIDVFANKSGFEQWQNDTGQDKNSKYNGTDFINGEKEVLLYNDTNVPKTISLGNTLYKDLFGNQVAGSITLEPFTSKIIIETTTTASSDIAAPTISTFSIPVTSNELTVPVTSFTAFDNVGVTGYKLTESSVIPDINESSWLASAPTSYTFSSEGVKTLYAWVKDAAGNISSIKNTTITITLPVNSSSYKAGNSDIFNLSSTTPNRRAIQATINNSGKVISLSIYHNGGTGNVILGIYGDLNGFPSARLASTLSTPVNSFSGWQTIPIVTPLNVNAGQKIWLTFVFQTNPGIRYMTGTPGRAHSIDGFAAGMPSDFGPSSFEDYIYSLYCTVTTESNTKSNDINKPIISSFTIPQSSSQLSVQITSFVASDNIGITGYKLTEFSEIPNANDEGWSASAPTSYLFTSEGTKILYAWVKDAAGNISSNVSNEITISTLQGIPKTVYSTENVSICQGDSYNGWTTAGQYQKVLVSTLGADSIVITNLTVNPTYEIAETVIINEGNSYWGFSEPGVYERKLTTVFGCDSIITTTLAVNMTVFTTLDISIKEGENYKGWTESGQYVENLKAATGADSILTINLTVLQKLYGTETIEICDGESYLGWNTSGQFERNLIAAEGNDSIVTTILTVRPKSYGTESITINEGENYLGWKTSGTYTKTLAASNGCDSIVTISLTVNPKLYTTENISICQKDSYLGWTASGQYSRNLTAITGADSIVTTVLTVNPIKYATEKISIYEGESYKGYTQSATFATVLASAAGCDSIVTTILTVTPKVINSIEYVEICEGESYEGWSESGQYIRSLSSANNLDSTVTTVLTVNPLSFITEEVTIKEGKQYKGYTKSSNFSEVFSTIHGCDSIVTTVLTVLPTIRTEEYITVNEGEVYNGWSMPGEYQRTLAAANGADSIVTTFLEVIYIARSTEIITICEGDSYEGWTVSGKYERLLKTVNGTDSIAVTNLTVNPIKYSTENISISEGQNYLGWTENGQYTRTLVSVTGCDSIVTTILSVEPLVFSQIISLNKGWNYFSSKVVPANTDMEIVLTSLINNGSLLEVQDENSNTLTRKSAKHGWVNNIGSLKQTEGYKIRLNSDTELEIIGKQVQRPLNIEIKSGINLISFPYNGSVDAIKVIKPLIDAGILDKVQDEKGNSIEFWGSSVGWVNGIGNFKEGEAYLVLAKNNGNLPIFDSYEKSEIVLANSEEPNFFRTNFAGNGSRHMNINIVGLNKSNIQTGDEIATFDGNICTGVVKINQLHLDNDVVSLNASVSDLDLVNGFTEGNSIQIRRWNSATNQTTNSQLEITAGEMVYQCHASVFGQLKSQTVTGIDNFENFNIDVYPNPATERLTVSFQTLPETAAKIIMRDLTGKELLAQNVYSNREVLNIQNLPSGIYLVSASGSNDVKKIVKK